MRSALIAIAIAQASSLKSIMHYATLRDLHGLDGERARRVPTTAPRPRACG